ncbi:hypothetical protein BIY24_07390 [Halobacteriovorax marinus]|uniref:glycosyltransferase family 2 protein n=1 Tax=Halobacteriovorax marinus TaxID=97084 RepID=UPI000BC30B5C|nr:glycosyltransferase [Halobacteriovorax marinus]ATH07776.1 hypothetical protein BIY24_07390 [Halobacteriovorax marinus]
MKKSFTSAITIVTITIICSLLVIIFYLNIPDNWQFNNPYANFVAKLMLYYLLFIFVRTFLLLILSFLEVIFYKKSRDIVKYPLVTLIIPAYNEEKVLKKAIESVLEIDYPNLEVLVVDDGSTDDTFFVAKEMEKHSQVRVIHQSNAGKSKALNYGISEALGDYFVCMDADSVLSKNLLIEAIPYFERDENLAAVAGAVQVGNANNLLTIFQKLEYIIGLNFHKKAQSFLNMVTIVPGPIGVFDRSKVYAIGGYSSDTFAEDSDLSMRLLMEGYNIKYCDKITATTEAPDEINALITQRYRWSRGMVQAIFKGMNLLWDNFSVRGALVITYMFFETILIPLINFSFIMLTLEFALLYNIVDLMGPYFVGLTLLDVALCFYSIIMERQVFSLLILSFLNRLTYGLLLEVIRFFSIFDELLKIPMKWGVLERKGMN